jgi:hypothetical protein
MVMTMIATLLLCLLRSHAHLFLGLSLNVFNKFRNSHAVLLGVDSKLALHCLNLLGRWSLSGLRHGDLTRPRLRARLRGRSRHDKCSINEAKNVMKGLFKKSSRRVWEEKRQGESARNAK